MVASRRSGLIQSVTAPDPHRRQVLARSLYAAVAWVLTPVALLAQEAATAQGRAGRSYALRGTVTAVSPDQLTVLRNTRHAQPVTFTLDAHTAMNGVPEVGARVSVRYRVEGDHNVAVAVSAQPSLGRGHSGN